MNADKITAWMKFAGKILEKLANIIDFVRSQFADIDIPGKAGGKGGAVNPGKPAENS